MKSISLCRAAARLAATAGLAVGAAAVATGPAAADGQGANTIQCSQVFPELHGTLVIGPNGLFNANCLEHFRGGPRSAETTRFDCSERLPDFPPEAVIGIQVKTKSGNLLTNCVVHF